MEGILWRAGRVRSSLHTLSSEFAAFCLCFTRRPAWDIRIVAHDNQLRELRSLGPAPEVHGGRVTSNSIDRALP